MQWMLTSSLQKVFRDQAPTAWKDPAMTLLKNQRAAFQAAFFCPGPQDVSITVQGVPHYTAYEVISMPSSYPCHPSVDRGYLRTEPGLYPDLLRPVDLHKPLSAEGGVWQSVFISLQDLEPGTYDLSVRLPGEEKHLKVTVLNRCLPKQTLYHTEWLHGDCLADYYGTEVFSPAHWQALEGFLKGAAHCGVNMILTPLFTPPLDTEPGGERTTIQLVDVFLKSGTYHFDFQKLRRFIELCRKYGISELEMSHLFTQWGAAAAPKVMVWEDGSLIRKFGWDTPATGGEYEAFLRVFLPELRAVLEDMGFWEHTWFHISDEPDVSQRESYEKARNAVREFLPESRCIDALSSFDFYQYGCITKPVVCEDHLDPFLKAGVPGLFTYYCTAQGLEVPNRFFSMPSGRNRILGTLLYVYDLKGFLHWGLNFYNSQFSKAHLDPFAVTDAGGHFPSGDPFLLYPAPDYSAWPSLRSEVLYEGLQDLRLLQLAESTAGREKVLSQVDAAAGYRMTFFQYPVEEAFFEDLQKRLLALI